MEYLKLLYELPAVLGGTLILAYASPWKLNLRHAPLMMFLVGLLVQFLPGFIDIALALVIPAGWLQAFLGIELAAHAPLKVTVPKLPRKVQLQEFATRAYPNPDDDSPERPDDEETPPEPEESPQVNTVRSFVPKL